MKDLKRSARTLNWILNACFCLLVLRGVFAAGFHASAGGWAGSSFWIRLTQIEPTCTLQEVFYVIIPVYYPIERAIP